LVVVQPMLALDPGQTWLHHWALVRAAMPGAPAAPGNGTVQPAAQCKQATFYKVRKILAQNFTTAFTTCKATTCKYI
jgi:hypothetical protein